MHVDTGHNFDETIEYRDRFCRRDWRQAHCSDHVQDIYRRRSGQEEKGPYASRNSLQTVTLLDAVKEFKFDAAMGGARRDEEKARAKERFFSFRNALWPMGSQESAARALEHLQRPEAHGRAFPGIPHLELD
jgi:sulfate adenylyltransferase subunit 2